MGTGKRPRREERRGTDGEDHKTRRTGNRPTQMGSKWEQKERAREIGREMQTIERQSQSARDGKKERDGRSGTEGLRVRDREMRWRDKTE